MFSFRLALALGMTVGRLRKEMSSFEFAQWMAYYKLEPFGEDRADLRAGIISASVMNSQRTKGKPSKPKDFMPDFKQDRRQKSPEALKRILAAMASATGGKVIRNG